MVLWKGFLWEEEEILLGSRRTFILGGAAAFKETFFSNMFRDRTFILSMSHITRIHTSLRPERRGCTTTTRRRRRLL